jgi:hypothetical protein
MLVLWGIRRKIEMTGSTIDHLVSATIFLGAILIFIGLFNQTIQTAILYQRHRHLSTKCSDLLDNILLNPGHPVYWGRSNCTPTSFGIQHPEFIQYRLSPFSLMRLTSATGEPFTYSKTGLTYSNMTMGFGKFLFVPYTEAINYSTASKLLGVNNTYGFQLTITPIMTVDVMETNPGSPLRLDIDVYGKGFPLSNATITYCFIQIRPGPGKYPSFESSSGNCYTDETGSATIEFQNVSSTDAYVLIAYAHLQGLVGVGYHNRVGADKRYVVPFIDSFEERRVLIGHSYDVHYFGPPESAVFYNATFVLLTEDFTLREMPMDNSSGKVGKVNYGEGQPYGVLTIPTYNPGILIITYESNNEQGVVMMPWGIGSLAFPVTFGGDPSDREWVTTDMRQVTVHNIAYQAMLSLWSLEGYGVIG